MDDRYAFERLADGGDFNSVGDSFIRESSLVHDSPYIHRRHQQSILERTRPATRSRSGALKNS